MERPRGDKRISLPRAHDSGYDALVLTVDTPVAGARQRDVRSGMTIPPTRTLRTLADMARRPAWWFNLLTTQPLEFASVTHWNCTVADLVGRMFDPGATLNDLHWLRAEWPRALIVKASSAPTTPAPSSTSARTPSSSRTTEAASLTELSPPSTCFPVSRPPSETAPRSSWTAVSPSEQTSSPQSGLGATAVLADRAYLYGLWPEANEAWCRP